MYGKPIFEMTMQEFAEFRVMCENLRWGNLPFGNCARCRNKGWIESIDENGYLYQQECECMENRRHQQQITESEYAALLRKCTFEKFTISESWQKNALARCKQWTQQRAYPLLYLGGRTGAGKTHLAVAAFQVRVQMGMQGKFVSWRTVSRDLKMNMTSPEYDPMLKELKYVKLLLIDDLFWTGKGTLPTEEDLHLAKEILDARLYNQRPTIITSQIDHDDLYMLNEAIAGRVVEYSGGKGKYFLSFGNDLENYRFSRKLEPYNGDDDPF